MSFALRLVAAQSLVLVFAWACSSPRVESDAGPPLGGGGALGSESSSDGGTDAGDAGARDAQTDVDAWHLPPPDATTPVFVCPTDASSSCVEPAPSFADVAPVFDKECGDCHLNMTDYTSLSESRGRLLTAVRSCWMAPETQADWFLMVNRLACGAPLGDVDAGLDAGADDGGAPDGSSDASDLDAGTAVRDGA